jgi:hypothetical protein
MAFNPNSTDLPVKPVFVFERLAVLLCQQVDKPETGIVPRVLVLRPGITQADDEF